MITITKEEFKNATGRDLLMELTPLDDTPDQAVARTIELWQSRTYDQIRAGRGYREDADLSEFQKEAIKRAIIQYGLYYLLNGDLYLASGADETGVKILYPQIIAIQYPQPCIDILRRAGLIRHTTNRRLSIFGEDY